MCIVEVNASPTVISYTSCSIRHFLTPSHPHTLTAGRVQRDQHPLPSPGGRLPPPGRGTGRNIRCRTPGRGRDLHKTPPLPPQVLPAPSPRDARRCPQVAGEAVPAEVGGATSGRGETEGEFRVGGREGSVASQPEDTLSPVLLVQTLLWVSVANSGPSW